MTILTLSKKLQSDIHKSLLKMPDIDLNINLEQANNFFLELKHNYKDELELFVFLGRSLIDIIIENDFVCLKEHGSENNFKFLIIIIHLLGKIYHDEAHQGNFINVASPSIGARLQGNQLLPLSLHTDFAMLDNPPEGTIIQCSREDPMGVDYGKNGVSLVKDIISLYFGSDELNLVLSTPMPFAGKRPSDGKNIIIYRPILEIEDRDTYCVRYHISRIHYAFKIRGYPATKVEIEVLTLFLKMAQSVRFELVMQEGDIAILNNRKVLHDRSLCSLQLDLYNSVSRETRIVFLENFYR